MDSGTDLLLSGSERASVGEYLFLWLMFVGMIAYGFWDISRNGK